jgi:hypothetical protein
MKKVLPLFRIYWFFWLNCCSRDNSSGVCVDDLSSISIFIIKFRIRVQAPCLLSQPPMTVLSDIHRCCARGFCGNHTIFQCPSSSFHDPSFPMWLGLVFRMLFVRVVFIILWLLHICRPKLLFVLVLKLLLDFNNISISRTE